MFVLAKRAALHISVYRYSRRLAYRDAIREGWPCPRLSAVVCGALMAFKTRDVARRIR